MNLEETLLTQNTERKKFVDNLRMDVVNGREVSEDDLKCAIRYLREDSMARGVKQAQGVKKKAAAAKAPAKKVDADKLLKDFFGG